MTDQDKVKAAQAIKAMRENITLRIELFALQAEMRKARYDAYCKAGFTPEQALALCLSKVDE